MKKKFQHLILHWLLWTAKLQLKKNKPLIIGVTGSAGKTSTVQAINSVIKTKFRVKSTHTGNSETGIPFEILDIPVKNWSSLGWIYVILLSFWRLFTNWKKYDVLVVEMGIDSERAPKNMSYLLTILQPKIGVFLNVNHVHGQNFNGKDTLFAITQEKGKLLLSLPTDGLAIFSKDHPTIVDLTPKIKAKQATFSIQQSAQIQLLKHQVSLKGTEFVFLDNGKQFKLNFNDQLLFKKSFSSFATTLLIAKELGINSEVAIKALEVNFKPLAGRSRVIAGINDSVLIDSSYNSSLEPTLASLEMLKAINIRGKKIAILGDMREIGKKEKRDHEELAIKAAKTADHIILIGPLTQKYTLPKLRKLKFPETKIHAFINAYQAIDAVKKLIKPRDLVLIKGSQNTIFLEIIVEEIMAEPSQASELLCRRSKYWEKQRAQLEL